MKKDVVAKELLKVEQEPNSTYANCSNDSGIYAEANESAEEINEQDKNRYTSLQEKRRKRLVRRNEGLNLDDVTCNDEQISLNESSSDDSGIYAPTEGDIREELVEYVFKESGIEELESKLSGLCRKDTIVVDFQSKHERELNGQFNRLTQEKQNLESEVERLSGEVNWLKGKQTDARQQQDDTLKKLSDKDSRIRELEEADEELERVEKKLDKMQEELSALKGFLDERLDVRNKENESLKQEITNLKSENATLKKELVELKSKANVDTTNESYLLPHVVAEVKDGEVVKSILRQNEGDPNPIDENGWTVLHHAAYNNQADKVKYLVEEKADFEIKDKNGKSPLDLAADKQNNEVVEFLQKKIKSKTDLNKSAKTGNSLKVVYASLATMLVVGTAISIASGLSALLITAALVVPALIAGGITYAISKPATELKEVNIQSPDNNKACEI